MSEPHRVIYNSGPRVFTRIFGSKEAAEQFASDKPESRIQPAIEPYQTPKECASFKLNDGKIPNTNVCRCGQRKLIAYQFCKFCDLTTGVHNHFNRK